MRIGLMRNQIEIWSTTKSINEYGVEVEAKELMLQCPAAAKYVKTDLQGNNIKQRQVVVEFTVRFNRFFNAPDESHYIRFDGDEWDIINTNNWHSLNKTITLTAVCTGNITLRLPSGAFFHIRNRKYGRCEYYTEREY